MSRPPVTRNALAMQAQGQPVPSSEATTIEQSRAIAQVQGALIVAQQRPRDEIRANNRMREACSLQGLAEHAFFRYSRGGGQITGPSIHLARELARCWGNIDYGVAELRRDAVGGQSEMLAYAWDLETNAKNQTTFIVPHLRDKTGGPVPLVDLRDVYENNQNNAARRLRECIFAVLPKGFVEEAKEICTKTLEDGGGEPLPKRREKLLEVFAGLGVSRARLERRMGRSADQLSALDLGTLTVVYRSIRRGEVTVEEEFPEDAADRAATELRQRQAPTDKAPAKAAEKKPPEPEGKPAAQTAAPPAEETKAPEKSAPAPAADDPPAVDLTPYQIPMPRRQDGSPHYTAWRGQIADRLAEAQDLATVDRLREANADWIDAAAGSDVEAERKEAQAIEARFADARKRITATTA